MTPDDQQAPSVLVWFEDSPEGRAALGQASGLARLRDASLAVVAVAAHERVIGCGRCLQGTVLWNLEMRKIAREELLAARVLLAGAGVAEVSYEVLIGDAAEMIVEAAARLGVEAIVLPPLRPGRLQPRGRRQVAEKVAAGGPWQVIVGPGAPGGGRVLAALSGTG